MIGLILRIAFDGRFLTPHYPGIGRYAFNLLRALPAVVDGLQLDWGLDVLLGKESERFPWSRLEGWLHVGVGAPVRGLREQIVVPRTLRRLGADVIHSPFLVAPYRAPCPLVVTIHDTIGLRSSEYLPSPLARLALRLATRLAIRSARAVITVSEASRRDLVNYAGASEAKIEVIPEAAAPELVRASPEAVEELRQRRRLGRRYALFVGTAKPHKNLDGLLRAFAALGDEACRLVIAGRRDPRYREGEQTARRLGLDVRFLGEVPESDLAALYSGAELLAVPSFVEGFGLPVVEAMACGTPVACSGVSSLPEVGGEAAAYFDPASTASMVETLRSLLRDAERRRELAARGLERAARFSWEQTARRTVEVYRRLAP